VLRGVTSGLALATAIVVVAACNAEDSAGIAAHVAAAGSLAPQPACETAPTPALPPAPRNLDPDAVAMVDALGARQTSPVFNASTVNAVPSMRTSSDGRLGVGVKVGTDEGGADNAVQLFLLRPESTVTTGVGMDPVGRTIQLSKLDSGVWTSTPPVPSGPGSIRQITMCSSAITSTGSTDIYDLTLFGIEDDTKTSARTYLMSVTVRVSNAKQPNATIASVKVHEVHRGANLAVPTLLEPMVTDDGKLLVGRLGSVPLDGWTGSTRYNIVYAYVAGGLCSNAALDDLLPMPFKPILNAPFDGALAGYGFRARPIRDAAGNLITTIGGPSTPDLSGTYPWIDRSGRNLFFTSIASKNQGSAKRRFASSACVDPPGGSSCFEEEQGDQTRGVAMVGSWTNGKIVLLDGPINNIDFGAGVTPERQQVISLYADGPPVRFASGRENGVTTLGPTVDNMTIIDALENLPNGTAAWVPRTRREVVWKLSRGHISDEIAFDDFLDPNVFLYAPMNAVIDNAHVGAARGRYYDGYDQTDPQCQSGTGDYVGVAQVRLQNAATRPPGMGRIPASGVISDLTNAVRVEPAALGGIHGRGLYLPAGAALSFPLDNPATGCTPVDACTDASSRTNSWYLGVFVDTRTTAPFTLWSISGRFSVKLSNTAVTVTPQGGEPIRVPGSGTGMMNRWTHLAVLYSSPSNRSAPGDGKLHVYLDGEWLGSAPVLPGSQHLLNPDWSASTLSVSAGSTGIWVDELKIVLNAEWMKANHEITCNHAMGSIYATAGGERCVPYYDGSTPSGTSKRSDYIGMTTNGVSNLHYNAPRPESFESNAFCKTCHVGGGPGATDVDRPAALSDQAIAFRHMPPRFDMAKTDPRRQPMLPPRVLTGNVPAGFYGPGLPASAKNCPTGVDDDCNVDTYLLPP